MKHDPEVRRICATAYLDHVRSLRMRIDALQEEIEHSLLTQNLLRLNTPPNSHMDVRKEHIDHLSSLDSSHIRRFDRAARYHPLLSLRSKQLVRVRWHVGWGEQKNIHLVLRITR